MNTNIDRLLEAYETGVLSRRQLGAALSAAMVGGAAIPALAENGSSFYATGLNHIALNCPDLDVSRDFYVKHLGMKVVRDNSSSCFLTCENNFLALFRSSESSLNHYCYSVKDYDVAQAEKKLESEGLNPRRAGNRIYFDDPHGVEVQLSAGTHAP